MGEERLLCGAGGRRGHPFAHTQLPSAHTGPAAQNCVPTAEIERQELQSAPLPGKWQREMGKEGGEREGGWKRRSWQRGGSEKKGRGRAGEINRIRQIQLVHRLKKRDVKEMGYKPRNQTERLREKSAQRKGKSSSKNKETEVGIAHVKDAGWPCRRKERWQGAGGLPLPLYGLSAARWLTPLSVIYNT